jgi:hypothetical protein
MLRLDRATNLLGPVRGWKRPAFWAWFSAHRDIRALLGLLIIVAAVIAFEQGQPFPGMAGLTADGRSRLDHFG